MKRLLSPWSYLFMGLVWARSAMATPVVEEPEAEEKPAVALWVEPLFALPMAALSALPPTRILMLPLGLSVPLDQRKTLVIELTPHFRGEHQSDLCEGECTSRALSLAVGMSWTAIPERSRGGFFVQLKLLGIVEHESVDRYLWNSNPSDEHWSATARQLSLGADLGYRFPFKHLFLEFVLGASVGRGWNVPHNTSAFTSVLVEPERDRADEWVWDVNPHLFRIGGRF